MTSPPVLLAGAPLRYPPEAEAACVGGSVVARCTITEEGRLVECRILSSPSPLLDQAVLDVLASRRYSPVYYEGRAQRVYYTLRFPFQSPCDAAPSSTPQGAGNQGAQPAGRLTCFLDDDGNTKNCHPEDSPTSLSSQLETVRVRCLLAKEGQYVNCRMIQGPPIVEDRMLEMLRKARPKPVLVHGQPVDTDVTLVIPVRFRMP